VTDKQLWIFLIASRKNAGHAFQGIIDARASCTGNLDPFFKQVKNPAPADEMFIDTRNSSKSQCRSARFVGTLELTTGSSRTHLGASDTGWSLGFPVGN